LFSVPTEDLLFNVRREKLEEQWAQVNQVHIDKRGGDGDGKGIGTGKGREEDIGRK
jgi:hypothetical protein